MNFDEIQIVRHGCELKVKPKTIRNQVITLNFGSSQFVISVNSRNMTHDKKMTPNRSQKYSAKATQKWTAEKIQSQKTRNFLGRFCLFDHMIS